MRDHDGRFAVKFDHLFDGFWVPGAQMLDHSISVLIDVLRHSFSLTRSGLLVPVQRALFPEIEVTDQQDGNVYHHFDKAVQSQLAKYQRPRIQKNRFHIEQNKDHRHEVELYGKGFARVAGRLHTTFVGLLLGLVWAAPADQLRKARNRASKEGGNQQVYD